MDVWHGPVLLVHSVPVNRMYDYINAFIYIVLALNHLHILPPFHLYPIDLMWLMKCNQWCICNRFKKKTKNNINQQLKINCYCAYELLIQITLLKAWVFNILHMFQKLKLQFLRIISPDVYVGSYPMTGVRYENSL